MDNEQHVRVLQDLITSLERLTARVDAIEQAVRTMQGQTPSQKPAATPQAPSFQTPATTPPPLPPEAAFPRVTQAPKLAAEELVAALSGATPKRSGAEHGGVEPDTTNTPQASPIAQAPPTPAAPAKPPKPARSIEQTIGTKWMLIAGVIALLAGGAYFFKLAMDMGWITPMRRLIAGTIWGLVMIAGAQVALRRGMTMFAAGLISVGIVWLYYGFYAASPNGVFAELRILDSTWSFLLMCAVTLLGMGLAVQTRMQLAAVISLVGAMATPVLLSTNENRQVELMTYLLAIDAGFLILAFAMRWQALAPLAMAGTIILFGGWFGKFYADEAYGKTLLFAWALAGVLMIYSVAALSGAALKRRSLSLGGADANTPKHTALGGGTLALAHITFLLPVGLLAILVWATSKEDVASIHAPALQFLAIEALVFAFSLWRRNGVLLAISFAIVSALMTTGANKFCSDYRTVWYACGYAWAMMAFPVLGVLLPRSRPWNKSLIAMFVVGGCVIAEVPFTHMYDMSPLSTGLHLLALNLLVLAVAQWRGWHFLRIGVLAWTALVLLFQHQALDGVYFVVDKSDRHFGDMTWTTTGWTWGFYSLLLADILIRAWRKALPNIERLEAALAFVATAGMFGATYGLLHRDYHDWMGLYTTLLAAGALAMVVALYRLAGRKILAQTMLVASLALLAIAAPIQFHDTKITVAWTGEALAAMAVAVLLRNRTLLFASPMLFALAVLRFLVYDLPTDPAVHQVWLGGAGSFLPPITHGLVLAVMLTGAVLLAAGILRGGKPIVSGADDRTLAIALVSGAILLWIVRTGWELPPTGATWWWMALAGVLTGVALYRTSRWLSAAGTLLLLAAASKWIAFDTLTVRLADGPDLARVVVFNWQFAAGIVLAIATLGFVRRLASRGMALPGPAALGIFIMDCLLLLWGGSFEIDRFFHSTSVPAGWDPYQSMQMALSLWWALYAAVLLALGFGLSRPAMRYLSFVLFGVTIVKVMLVDLGNIQMVYRVLSLMGLGVLLLAGSLLYHKRFASKG